HRPYDSEIILSKSALGQSSGSTKYATRSGRAVPVVVRLGLAIKSDSPQEFGGCIIRPFGHHAFRLKFKVSNAMSAVRSPGANGTPGRLLHGVDRDHLRQRSLGHSTLSQRAEPHPIVFLAFEMATSFTTRSFIEIEPAHSWISTRLSRHECPKA